MSGSNGNQPQGPIVQTFDVDLPAGGRLQLQSAEEQSLWEDANTRYIDEYHLSKHNDLVLLGAILQQQILMFRAQRRMNGMKPVLDANNVPTGQYAIEPVDSDEIAAASKQMNQASDQVRALEKALGIDKATREAGGSHTVANYITTLKRAAFERGIHITERTIEYESFVNDLRWRIRVLNNADAEDRAYHDISPDKILAWVDDRLKHLEQIDKDYATQKHKVYVGKL